MNLYAVHNDETLGESPHGHFPWSLWSFGGHRSSSTSSVRPTVALKDCHTWSHTHLEVLEHTPDPLHTLRFRSPRLSANGILFDLNRSLPRGS